MNGSDRIPPRFAFACNGGSGERFALALVRTGVRRGTPATLLLDGDAGLRNLQRRVLPKATVVLDWLHIAMRFEHALRTGLGGGTIADWIGKITDLCIECVKWRIW